MKQNTKHFTLSRGCAAAFAAMLVCATISMNPVETFAKENNSPIKLSALSATPLNVRSYQNAIGDFYMDVNIPEIKSDKTLSKETNDRIQKIADSHVADAQKAFADYKKDFFATGGTEKDWNDRKMDIIVDYDVKHNQEDILSLELTTATCWVSDDTQQYFYNLDLKNNTALTLEGLLGKDYVKICNDSIQKQIKERMAADKNLSFFSAEEGGFTTIDKNTSFYLNKEGKVVISFPEYSIAPGYMGVQEFVIQK